MRILKIMDKLNNQLLKHFKTMNSHCLPCAIDYDYIVKSETRRDLNFQNLPRTCFFRFFPHTLRLLLIQSCKKARTMPKSFMKNLGLELFLVPEFHLGNTIVSNLTPRILCVTNAVIEWAFIFQSHGSQLWSDWSTFWPVRLLCSLILSSSVTKNISGLEPLQEKK